ncbi:hypothetical protein N2S64_07805, partial [Escherichia coli]|nr:hypothetical protein [Escherichia coli]
SSAASDVYKRQVHHRVKLLYGEGLHIRRLEPGTEIAFYIPNQRTPVASQATLLL